MAQDYVHRDYETFQKLLPERSGNDVNGLNAHGPEHPRPFFWHPPNQHEFGDLQQAVIGHQRQAPEIAAAYSRDADRGPRPIEKSPEPEARPDHEWSHRVKEFARMNESVATN